MRLRLAGIALSVFFASTVGQQQFQAGVYSMSGSLSYSSVREEAVYGFTMNSTRYHFGPEISTFVSEGIELTFGPTYARNDFEYTNIGSPTMEGTSITLGVALGLRNYLIQSSVAPFIGGGGRVSWSKQQSLFNQSGYTPPVWMYFVEAGVSFAVTTHFAIEPGFQYTGDKDESVNGRSIEVGVRFKYFVFE